MITIQRADDVFSVDTEQTQRYDEAHSLCDCGYCRNYYAQIKGKLPEIRRFFKGVRGRYGKAGRDIQRRDG